MKKLLFSFLLLLSILLLFSACTPKGAAGDKLTSGEKPVVESGNGKISGNGNQGITVNKISYEIVDDTGKLPEEIRTLVEQPPETETIKTIKDGEENQYLFIGLGQRATAGYDIEISSVEDVEGRISVVFRETTPPKDSMSAEVITFPCKVLFISSPLPIDVKKVD